MLQFTNAYDCSVSYCKRVIRSRWDFRGFTRKAAAEVIATKALQHCRRLRLFKARTQHVEDGFSEYQESQAAHGRAGPKR